MYTIYNIKYFVALTVNLIDVNRMTDLTRSWELQLFRWTTRVRSSAAQPVVRKAGEAIQSLSCWALDTRNIVKERHHTTTFCGVEPVLQKIYNV